MSRRCSVVKRKLLVDPKFKSEILSKFINILMVNGKKSIAENIIYVALDFLADKTKTDHMAALEKALENVKPNVEVKSRRVGGSTYQVPIEVRADRKNTLGIRWIIAASRKRSEKSMGMRLAYELFDAYEGKGGAVKKKEDVHKMAEANKAFSHYRW